jgi:hypothetical protein
MQRADTPLTPLVKKLDTPAVNLADDMADPDLGMCQPRWHAFLARFFVCKLLWWPCDSQWVYTSSAVRASAAASLPPPPLVSSIGARCCPHPGR